MSRKPHESSVTITGRLTILPAPMIALSGWLISGMPMIGPKLPTPESWLCFGQLTDTYAVAKQVQPLVICPEFMAPVLQCRRNVKRIGRLQVEARAQLDGEFEGRVCDRQLRQGTEDSL